jgi:hypothetical protein
MTRDELKAAVDGWDDAKLAAYSLCETAAIEAHVRQANTADGKVEALANKHAADRQALVEQHDAELAKLRDEHEAALTAHKAEVAVHRTKLAEHEAAAAPFGGLAAFQQLNRLAAAERLRAEIAANQVKLAAMGEEEIAG